MISDTARRVTQGGIATLLFCGMLATLPSSAQDAPVKRALPSQSGRGRTSTPQKKAKTEAAPAPAAHRPITKAEAQQFWASGNDDNAVIVLNARHLAFEPQENWLAELPRLTGVERSRMPNYSEALRKLIPPAPDLDTVAGEAPALLEKLKQAAQKRSELDMEPLVHPDLLQDKAKVYTLFDTTNYRAHVFGRFSPQENRRVGVQFFQLTTSQVETLHYIFFATSHGKLVVQDIITGPDVARLFLADEEKVALAKLNLMFRALNDGDVTGLKNLCTPGLYESLLNLAPDPKAVGTFLTKGQLRTVETSSVKASVPLDQKSIRVVVRIAYPTRSGRQIQFDVDFERIDHDLKVVRLRDTENKVIAWDPNIDNYLNRRYGLPDGPPADTVALSEMPDLVPLPRIRKFAETAVDTRNGKRLKDYAEQFLESDPTGSEGLGMRASAEFLLGDYDTAQNDATVAIQRGGTVYLYVMRNGGFMGDQFYPVVLGISNKKIDYRPPAGQNGGAAREDIPITALKPPTFEKLSKLDILRRATPRPFLRIDFHDRKDHYNLAAFGTKSMTAGTNTVVTGPADWERSLIVVQSAITTAIESAGGAGKGR